jgi:hypothetical protein
MVDSKGDISVLNETFHIGGEYIGEYIWATIDTGPQSLTIQYNDEKLMVSIIALRVQVYKVVNDLLSFFEHLR